MEVNHQPVGVEQTLLLQPDMVLLYDHQAGPFEAAGFNGLARIVSPVRKHYQKIFKMFGYLTGKTQRTQDIFLRKQVLLEKLFASIPSPKDMSPVTMLTLSHERLHLFPSLFEDYNINLKLLNAVNLAEKTVAQGAVNTEALLKLNPDVIFLYNYRNQLTVQDIYNNRALAGLSAVRNKLVYRMPNGASRMTGPVEEPLLFYWMSQLLHPEAMPIVSFRQLVKDTYSEIFGYMPTEADVDYVLSIHENQFSAYYDKFAACGAEI
jgi:iron complex transport system substrate-binding protein